MDRIIAMKWEKISLIIPEKPDVDVMFKAMANWEITKYTWTIWVWHKENEEDYYEHLIKSKAHFFMIMENWTKEVIWWIWFHKYDVVSRNWEIWIMLYKEEVLSKWYWSEAMKLFLKYVFEYLWVNKVKLLVFSNNPRWLKSYLKCGFKEVGRLRQEKYLCWEYVDSIIMDMLSEEYFINLSK